MSAKNLGVLQTATGIEADNAFRLWELWYQQSFLNNQYDVKIGQQSPDQEFMVSSNALLFLNAAHGGPVLPAVDLLSGGPVYPLSAVGVRVRSQPQDSAWSFLGGIFNDDASGAGAFSGQNPQQLNNHGINLRLSDNAFIIGEMQYLRPGPGDMEFAGHEILPGTYRLGAWYDFGTFAAQRFGTDGLSLAIGNGIPERHHDNYSVYGVIDQIIWRENAGSKHSVNFFLRGMGAPNDRNTVNFSANSGFTLHEPFIGREDDTVGIGVGYAHISGSARALDIDSAFPVNRSAETFIEVTYQYALAPWLQLQPDFQYVINPGAGVTNPNNLTTNKRLGDEAIFGIRTNITF